MTGLQLTVTNEFGQTTATEYNDSLLRPTRAYAVNFTAPETQTIYDDNALTVKVRKQIDANNWDEATTFMDSLGRAIKTQAKDSQGDVFVETHYDLLGRVDRVTNPYRAGDTVLWSKTRYDEMGRAVETFAPTELANLASAQSLGTTAYDVSTVPGYFGIAVTTTDAAGKKGRSITNALGQLIVVEEPNHQGNVDPLPQSTPNPLPTPTPGGGGGPTGGCLTPENCPPNLTAGEFPSYATFYKYNALGKMVEVTQGAQKRWFKYDSLGRLLRVSQPEQEKNTPSLDLTDIYNASGQWTAGFAYDLLGNVLRATDANGVNIVNEYDKANRVTKRCYTKPGISTTATLCSQIATGDLSIDTPPVEFFYDGKGLASQQSPNFAKGKLTKVTNGFSVTEYMTFDNFGRLTRSKQITDGVEYGGGSDPNFWMTYTYNLSGALVEERYPSGRVVKNEFESDGDLLLVSSQKAGATFFTPFASNFSYTASGGISQMRLGNGKWETAKFNDRLQVTELGLGASAADASTWKVNYEYGELNPDGTTVNTAKNTGNIARQTLTIPGTSFVQSYRYDSLYRLTEAKETTGTNTNWIQNWGYDRYGNRTSFTQNIGGLTNAPNPSIDPNTNRFTPNQGFGYDKNGNIIADIAPETLPRTFVFNGDNKQTEVKKDGVTIGRYYYDGEGKRVKKVTDTETTIFVYSAGKLIAEYSTQLSQTPSVNYTTTDHLGSPRIITDQLGQVKARRDFLPFGEELFVNVGARSADLKYGSYADNVRQKFTGYQKDNETSLDFAEARMYANRFGRFTAVDPLLASGKSGNPQSFNRFVYTLNDPINMVDPDGLKPIWVYRLNRNTGKTSFTRIDSKYLKANEKLGWKQLNERLPYSYMSDDGYPVSLTANGEVIRHKTMQIRFDPKGNPIVGWNVMGAFVSASTGGLLEFGDPNSREYQNSRTAFTIVQYAALIKAGVLGAASIYSMAKSGKSGVQLAKDLAGIFKSNPATCFNCVKTAEQTLSAFSKAGIKGDIVELVDKAGAPILRNVNGEKIAETGFHRVVQVGDRFFDSLTGPNGATWDEYLKLLHPDTAAYIQRVPVGTLGPR